ncbi:MAG: hypothetical protein ACRDHP_16470, partial [Ktedonobacterales bacterium]
ALRSQGNARLLAALVAGGLVGATAYVSVDNTFWVYGLGTYFWLLAALPYARVFATPSSAKAHGGPPVVDGSTRDGPDAALPPAPGAAPTASALHARQKSATTGRFTTQI